MVYEINHFTAACFHKNQTSDEILKIIRKLWIMTYLVQPDYLSFDQGSNYISK